ncbi:MAG: nucleoside recognition protein [Bacteroidales bacterium]
MVTSSNSLSIIRQAAGRGWHSGLRTARWILGMTLGVSFVVMLLQYFGFTQLIAEWISPLFIHLGLSGEAALVFISAVFVNIYAAIAVIDMIGFDIRSITILATMCLCAHNLIIESTIQYKTGASVIRMLALRLTGAIVSAFILNQFLPQTEAIQNVNKVVVEAQAFVPTLLHWLKNTALLLVQMFCIIMLLTISQRILADLGLIRWISKLLRPLMYVLGLPAKTSFLWFVGQTLGIAYGGAVMIEEKEEGKVSVAELNILNHHLAISHSNIEDLLLFVSVGALVPWVLFVRVGLAAITVWLHRLEIIIRKTSNLQV